MARRAVGRLAAVQRARADARGAPGVARLAASRRRASGIRDRRARRRPRRRYHRTEPRRPAVPARRVRRGHRRDGRARQGAGRRGEPAPAGARVRGTRAPSRLPPRARRQRVGARALPAARLRARGRPARARLEGRPVPRRRGHGDRAPAPPACGGGDPGAHGLDAPARQGAAADRRPSGHRAHRRAAGALPRNRRDRRGDQCRGARRRRRRSGGAARSSVRARQRG